MNLYLFWIVRLCIIGIVLAPLVLSPHTVFPFVVGKSLWIRSLIIIAVTSFSILAFRKPEFRPKFSKILVVFGFFILHYFCLINIPSKSAFCFNSILPSFDNSSAPAKMLAKPDFFKILDLLNSLGISSRKFFHSDNLPKNVLILFMPSSVVSKGSLGILILIKSFFITLLE